MTGRLSGRPFRLYFFSFVKLLTTCGFEVVIFCERRTFPSRLCDCHVDKIDDNNLAKPFCYFASP
jgi:hypothetical protein